MLIVTSCANDVRCDSSVRSTLWQYGHILRVEYLVRDEGYLYDLGCCALCRLLIVCCVVLLTLSGDQYALAVRGVERIAVASELLIGESLIAKEDASTVSVLQDVVRELRRRDIAVEHKECCTLTVTSYSGVEDKVQSRNVARLKGTAIRRATRDADHIVGNE